MTRKTIATSKPLFGSKLSVLNVGLASFADAIERAGGEATQVDWKPAAGGDAAIADALARLVNAPSVEAANNDACEAYLAAQPMLAGVGVAREMLPGMTDRTILHSGPPIAWPRMCGPMRGAIVGAILYEGWASDAGRASEMAASGDIAFAPCHHSAAVGPMSGIISPSMPVWIVRNAKHGNLAFSNLNEGLGKVLRFGANSPEVIARLSWMANVLAPALRSALEIHGRDAGQAAHGAGAAHGRRGPQPQRCRVLAAREAARLRRC